MLKFILLLSTLLLSSCASYMQGIYRDLDRGSQRDMLSNRPQYQAHRNRNRYGSVNDGRGKVTRRYQRNPRAKKRASAEDLLDNAPSLSLWAGSSTKSENLFTEDARKRNGDIVLINVESSLKDEISSELKRAFPARKAPAPKKEDAAADPAAAAAAAAAPAAPPSPDDEKVQSTVYDRISSVIIEEVNKNYLLLRGRKTVLFRQRKRLIELQALVARRDISIEDTISSGSLLEATINIVR